MEELESELKSICAQMDVAVAESAERQASLARELEVASEREKYLRQSMETEAQNASARESELQSRLVSQADAALDEVALLESELDAAGKRSAELEAIPSSRWGSKSGAGSLAIASELNLRTTGQGWGRVRRSMRCCGTRTSYPTSWRWSQPTGSQRHLQRHSSGWIFYLSYKQRALGAVLKDGLVHFGQRVSAAVAGDIKGIRGRQVKAAGLV
eukprot:4815659-Pleurochrysis_carterae.AAC.1